MHFRSLHTFTLHTLSSPGLPTASKVTWASLLRPGGSFLSAFALMLTSKTPVVLLPDLFHRFGKHGGVGRVIARQVHACGIRSGKPSLIIRVVDPYY